jgi:hypothetical protein
MSALRRLIASLAVAAGLVTTPSASAATITEVLVVPVAGILSMEEYGDPLNTVLSFGLPANADIIGIGWQTMQTANAPSFLSEMVVSFETSSALELTLTPGIGDNFAGTASYSSGGIVNLVGSGFDFELNADGVLRMEFFETFNDFIGGPDGRWDAGTISIRYQFESTEVSEPATLVLAAIALLGVAARSRRR